MNSVLKLCFDGENVEMEGVDLKQKTSKGKNVAVTKRGKLNIRKAFVKVRCTYDHMEDIAELEDCFEIAPQEGDGGEANLPFSRLLREKGVFKHPDGVETCPRYQARQRLGEAKDGPEEDLPQCNCIVFTPAQQQELVRIQLFKAFDVLATLFKAQKEGISPEDMGDRRVTGGKGYRYLVKNKFIIDAFPMHRDPETSDGKKYDPETHSMAERHAIYKEHCSFFGTIRSAFHFTKSSERYINFVRDYYGEKLALYFAFLHFFNTWLIFLIIPGAIIYSFQKARGKSEAGPAAYCILLVTWGSFFLKFWSRKENDLAWEWNMWDHEETERELEDFVSRCERHPNEKYQKKAPGFYEPGGRWVDLTNWLDSQRRDPENKEIDRFTPMNYRDVTGFLPNCILCCLGGRNADEKEELNAIISRSLKQFVSGLVMIFMICVVIGTTLGCLYLRLVLVDWKPSGGGILAGVVNAAAINLLDAIYMWLAVKLTEWENYRTSTLFEDKLIQKVFPFQFFNSYFSLFYIGFFKSGVLRDGKLFDRTEACVPTVSSIISPCLDEMETQLLSLLASRITIGNITETFVPWLMSLRKLESMKNERVEELRTLILGRDATSPRVARRLDDICKSDDKAKEEESRALLTEVIQQGNISEAKLRALVQRLYIDELPYHEKEFRRPKYEFHPAVSGVFFDYNELVINFGYLVMFGAAFSLSPCFLLVGNLIEHANDGYKILITRQRPVYYGSRDIGTHLTSLKLMLFAGVITNTGIIFYTSRAFDEVSDPTTKEMVQEEKLSSVHKLFWAVIAEHIVVILMFGVFWVFNDMRPSLREESLRATKTDDVVSEYQQWKPLQKKKVEAQKQKQAAKEQAQKERAAKRASLDLPLQAKDDAKEGPAADEDDEIDELDKTARPNARAVESQQLIPSGSHSDSRNDTVELKSGPDDVRMNVNEA